MNIGIFPLDSSLHDASSTTDIMHSHLEMLGMTPDCVQPDFSSYGSHALDIIYVLTGGTERKFLNLLPQLTRQAHGPIYLLANGENNSLAASLEILSYLRGAGVRAEMLHGLPEDVSRRIELLEQAGAVRMRLSGQRLGVIGRPSDWLIASTAKRPMVRERLGIELCDIGIDELFDTIATTADPVVSDELAAHATEPAVAQALPMALRIHDALSQIVERHNLDGFTLRCFDLLKTVHNTGCLALALLNSRGIVAGCEGDVPAMLSMAIGNALLGMPGFMANPTRVNAEAGLILMSHCTIPLSLLKRYDLDTHFESGLGVAVRGYMAEGPVTLFKVSGDLSRHYAEQGMLIRSQSRPLMCRTQQIIHMRNNDSARYFITDPIGNHHVVLPGHCKAQLDEILYQACYQ